MDFVDATILRFADEPSRNAVFDDASLIQLLSASHDAADIGVEAPFALVVDEISFVHDDESRVDVDGSWMTIGQTERTELALRAPGLGAPMPRIDILLSGAVIATSLEGGSRVATVDMNWLDLAGIDAEIDPLPADPAVLEQRRRERLLIRIRAHLDQPAAFDDAALDRLLARLDARSVTELMSRPFARSAATLAITFGEGTDEIARRRRFPLAAALLVRNTPLSIASLLDETRRIRAHLHRLGFHIGDAGPRARSSPIVAWVVPAALFDDEAWPGATGGDGESQRAQRRAWAGAWLASERIGLIVPPP
jgi:hypothetical protein